MSHKKLSRKQKVQYQQHDNFEKSHLVLKNITPLTMNQRRTFVAFNKGKDLFLHGFAGTGKSFISIYLSLLELETERYDKLIIYRSTVPTRDVGFLPGKLSEKIKVYETPYYAIFSKLYNRSDAYELLKNRKKVEFESTCFLRGITIENAIVIVDECQNLTKGELNSLITRIGDKCKVIFCGDIRQLDPQKNKERSGLHDFYKILLNMPSFETIEFGIDDIVRSKFVKDYIITRAKLEDSGEIESINAT